MFVVSEYAACVLIMFALTGLLLVVCGIGYAMKTTVVALAPAIQTSLQTVPKYLSRSRANCRITEPAVEDVSI
jgi:hypothetical protein